MSMLRRLFTSLPKVCKPHSTTNILPKTARYLPQHSGIYKPTFFFSESSKQPDADPKGIKFDLNDPLPDNVEIDVDGKTIKTKDGKVVYEIPSEVKGATLGDSERYLIMMTCNICNNKMQKTFTKKSYHTGVVLVTCDNCENIHLIADNLGWFRDTPVNVEDLAKEKGNQAVKISNNARLQQILQNIKYVGYKDTIDPAKQSEAENSSEQNGTVAQLGEAEGEKNKK